VAERHPRPRYTKDNYALVLITVVITICWGAAAPDTQWAMVVTAALQATTLFGALRASSVTGRTLRLLVAVWLLKLHVRAPAGRQCCASRARSFASSP